MVWKLEEKDLPANIDWLGIGVRAVYGIGESSLLARNLCRVAIVGSRRMTDYGKGILEKIMSELVSAGVIVVSGMMNGVDETAHNLCLDGSGKTIAVLGWGIEYKCSKRLNMLKQRIIDNHSLVISEYEDTQRPQMWTFPRRNRIVVAISDVVVIVEGAVGSGSMISADWARKLNKPLLVFPGPITSSRSEGVNMLLNKGLARAVTGATDILEALDINRRSPDDNSGLKDVRQRTSEKDRLGNLELTREERGIIEVLESDPKTIDEIAKILKISVEILNSRVTVMALNGLIIEKGGYLISKIK